MQKSTTSIATPATDEWTDVCKDSAERIALNLRIDFAVEPSTQKYPWITEQSEGGGCVKWGTAYRGEVLDVREEQRNQAHAAVTWRFTTEAARTRLARLYPELPS